MSILRFGGVVREVGEFRILDGVDAAIAAGDRVGLVGPNGAGKTTLLKLAAGIDDPDRGEISRKRGLSIGLVMLAALTALLGYVVPKFAVPLLSDSAWAHVPSRLADDSVPVLVALELLMLGGAGALFAMAGMAVGGWGAGFIFDLTTSYATAFATGLAFNAANFAILLFLLGRDRRRDGAIYTRLMRQPQTSI